jgi:Carboxypeptidase regulatory-like domain
MAGTWETARHRAALGGRVKDARTGEPLAAVRVEITAGPAEFTSRLTLLARQHGELWAALVERLDRTRTARDGFFRFLDLPAGQYTLSASLPGSGTRYGTATAKVTLSAGGQGSVSPGTVELALPATTIQGRIRSTPNASVWMAEVRIQGSGERTWTNAQGHYVLSGVEAGARRLTISASGFRVKSEAVTLGQPGESVTRDVALSPV